MINSQEVFDLVLPDGKVLKYMEFNLRQDVRQMIELEYEAGYEEISELRVAQNLVAMVDGDPNLSEPVMNIIRDEIGKAERAEV